MRLRPFMGIVAGVIVLAEACLFYFDPFPVLTQTWMSAVLIVIPMLFVALLLHTTINCIREFRHGMKEGRGVGRR